MTGVATESRATAAPEPDSVPLLLRCLGATLNRTASATVEEMLSGLARCFGVRGAGVAGPHRPAVTAWLGEAAAPFPWQGPADPLWALAERGETAAFTDATSGWLLWFARREDPNRLLVLWLNDAPTRTWSETQTAALGLAGHALMRAGVLEEARAEVEDRLAHAAHVASRLSHDMGNILTGVLGFTELALGQVTPASHAQRYLQEVWQVALGGAEWLKKLNHFCRRRPPEFAPTGLPGTLAEEEARRGPGQPARWQADIPADLPALACDPDSLRQALREVLDNALEATADHGPVLLTARAVQLDAAQARRLLGQPMAGRFVRVTVADGGAGFTADVRGRLFRDFFFSTKPRHRGMGLLMVYGIVQRFGGALELGTGQAGGAEVHLYFPAAPDPEPAAPATLLVIDEDPQVLADARRILEPAGYRVQVAMSPIEGLALYQATVPPFELVLSAVHQTGITGPELIRRMQLRDPRANFLFLHAPAGPGLPRDELVTPATLVHKPFAAAVLLQAVAAALRRARQSANA